MRKLEKDAESQVDPQLKKLSLEIADLQWKVGRTYKVAQVVSIASVIIAVVAFLGGLYQFNAQQEREVKKPVSERQLALEFELSDVAATIAILKPDDPERKKAEARFRELHWGPIVYVVDSELEDWMGKFDSCLNEFNRAQTLGEEAYEETPPGGCASLEQQEEILKRLSLDLAVMRRNKLEEEWDLKGKDIHKSRGQNIPTPYVLP